MGLKDRNKEEEFPLEKMGAVSLHMLEEHSRFEWHWLKHRVWGCSSRGCSAPYECLLWDCPGLNTGGSTV